MAQRPIAASPKPCSVWLKSPAAANVPEVKIAGSAGIPQGAAEQLRNAAAAGAKCGVAVGTVVDVENARWHFQEKKAEETFCFSQPVPQIAWHINKPACVLQNGNAIGQRFAAEWRERKRYAVFSSQPAQILAAGNGEREKR